MFIKSLQLMSSIILDREVRGVRSDHSGGHLISSCDATTQLSKTTGNVSYTVKVCKPELCHASILNVENYHFQTGC